MRRSKLAAFEAYEGLVVEQMVAYGARIEPTVRIDYTSAGIEIPVNSTPTR